MVTPQLEIAYDHGPADVPDVADWTDLSTRLIFPIITDLGTSQSRAVFALSDSDGLLHPDVVGRVLMRHARLSIDTGSTVIPLWRGFVNRWAPLWQYNESRRDVRLRDALSWLALEDGVDVDLPAQRSQDRVNAILDLAGWPAALRDIDAGARTGVRLEALEREGANLLRLLDETTDAEDGRLWCDADGNIVFRGRLETFDAASVATIVGETATVGDLVARNRVSPKYDTDVLYTAAQVQSADGEVVERTAAAAEVADLGRRVLPVRDVGLPRSEAETLAEWVVVRFGVERLWLPGVGVDATQDLSLALGLAPGDRVSFVHDAGGSTESVEGVVDRVHCEVVSGRVLSTLDLSPWFGEGPWFTWDTAGRGWDQGAKWGP